MNKGIYPIGPLIGTLSAYALSKTKIAIGTCRYRIDIFDRKSYKRLYHLELPSEPLSIFFQMMKKLLQPPQIKARFVSLILRKKLKKF